jgi:DMSO/TMAO reductase YedYZ heme-binding membrane subunit
MMLMTVLAQQTEVATKLWWHISRASGIVAWGLAAVAVVWGVALSTRALGKKPPAPWLLAVHRFLGALCVSFTVVHVGALTLDPVVPFKLDELFVPMASAWKPVAVAWGIAAFYLLIAVEVTSLLRKRIPKRLWRWIHMTSYGLYVFATVHLLTAGTDRTNPLLLAAVLASIALVIFFTGYRLVGPGRAASVRSPAKAAPSPTTRRVPRQESLPASSPAPAPE